MFMRFSWLYKRSADSSSNRIPVPNSIDSPFCFDCTFTSISKSWFGSPSANEFILDIPLLSALLSEFKPSVVCLDYRLSSWFTSGLSGELSSSCFEPERGILVIYKFLSLFLGESWITSFNGDVGAEGLLLLREVILLVSIFL